MTRKKTLLLTGGSQGIGRATVEFFLHQGWRAVFVARGESGIRECLDGLAAQGFGEDVVRGIPLDVSDLDAVEAFPSVCPFLEDGLDALVLNAFYQKTQPVADFTREELDKHWRINNLSPILLIQSCLEALKKQRGAVVYVGSVSDERASPGYAAYGASKAYMLAFVRHAATELGPLGVRINVVSPGCVDTPALQIAIDALGEDGQAAAEALCQRIPLDQRWAAPSEIAEAIWFAVTGPRYFHGRDLRVDGGIY